MTGRRQRAAHGPMPVPVEDLPRLRYGVEVKMPSGRYALISNVQREGDTVAFGTSMGGRTSLPLKGMVTIRRGGGR